MVTLTYTHLFTVVLSAVESSYGGRREVRKGPPRIAYKQKFRASQKLHKNRYTCQRGPRTLSVSVQHPVHDVRVRRVVGVQHTDRRMYTGLLRVYITAVDGHILYGYS